MISPEARVAFLRRIHLFQELGEEDLARDRREPAGRDPRRGREPLLPRATTADKFFIIQRGAVLHQHAGARRRTRARLPDRRGLLRRGCAAFRPATRVSNAVASEAVTLFSLARDRVAGVSPGRLPKLKKAFQVVAEQPAAPAQAATSSGAARTRPFTSLPASTRWCCTSH